jgi:hypothetical protein
VRFQDKPNLDDSLTDLEIKKVRANAFENSNWGKFLNTAATWAGDVGKGFSDAWSPAGDAIGKGFNAAVNKFGAENITKAATGLVTGLGGGAVLGLTKAQDVIELESKSRYNADVALREQQQQELNFLKQSDPASALIPKLEEALSKPVAEPITGPAGTLTFLDQKVYEPWFESFSTGLLAMNPDIIKQAREENRGVWATARDYANDVSFGQAGFDLTAGLFGDNVFNIDVTDEAERNWLFYEGDGLVGNIGKTTSGAIDLTKQLLLDPLWVAGKGAKLARTFALDTATVQEANGINRLWQQSYFVEGKTALKEYAQQQKVYSEVKDTLTKLEQDRLAARSEIALIDDKLANPTKDTSVQDLLAQKDLLKQQSAKLAEDISQIKKSQPAVPTLAAGHAEFYDQILTGQLRAVDLVNHSRLLRWGAMKNKMAEVYELAAKNGDVRDLIDIDLIAMGIDPQAATRLRARRESLLTIVEDQKTQLNEFKTTLKAMAGDGEAAKQIVDESYSNAKKLYEAYLIEDGYLAAAVASEEQRVASIVGQLDPRAASRFKSVEAKRAEKARARTNVQFETFQNTSLGRPVHLLKVAGNKVSGRYRPSNMVVIEGLDQADGVDELVAWFQLVGSGKVAGKLSAEKLLTPEFFNSKLNEFIVANGRAGKEKVLETIDREILKKLLISAKVAIPEGKVGQDLLEEFLTQWINFKNKRVALLREEGFYTDASGAMVKAPLLKPELAYSYYLTDVRDMAKWVSENTNTLNTFFDGARKSLINEGTFLRQGWDNVGETAILLDQMWRFGVLARLGYPVRNVGTEWLKFSVVGGMMKVFSPYHSSLDQLPKALKKSAEDWASNKYNFYKRVSLSLETRANSSWQIGMKDYPEYVKAQNDLRKSDILQKIENMEYDKFVILSNKMANDPALLAEQPDFIQNAHVILQEIKDSQDKLAGVMERFASYSKVQRRTGTVEIYGFEFEEAYAGTQGQFLKDALSSGPTIEMMSAGMKQAGSSSKWLNIDSKVYPDYPEYYPNLSNYIQNKVINSPTALRVLELTNIEDDAVALARRESLIKDLKNNIAYRDEIMGTGNYNKYKSQIRDEDKEIKLKLIENGYLRSQKEEFASAILSTDEVNLLDQGILPERFGTSSPEYVEAAKAEAKRLGKEYSMLGTPEFDEKQINFMSVFPLSPQEAKVMREQGLVPYKTIKDAWGSSRSNTDELSAILSTGYSEAASAGNHFSSSGYRFYSPAELRYMAFKVNGKLHIELPWAKQTKNDYISENMASFNENWGDIRGEEILQQFIDEKISWIDTHMPVDELLENMDARDLVRLGIGNVDNRSIEERYIDYIEELFTRYIPEPKLRSEILTLKAGESIRPERIRYYLEDRGFNLSPITGDLLVDATRKRAQAFKRIRGTAEDATDKTGNLKYELTSASRLLDESYIKISSRLKGWKTKTEVEKPSAEWRTLTPEEQVRAIEANKLLRASDKDLSMAYMFKDFRSKVFKYIGQIPEDNLVRWPFGGTVYNNHIEQIAKQWYKAGFEPTQADMYALHTSARARAIAESRRYLYTATRKLNGVGNVPFLSGFYQAAITGTKNWGRVTWNDPSILARRVWMLNYINHYADYDKQNGNRTVTINMPKWIVDSLPEDSAYARALSVYPELKFDVRSFNLVFPGMRLGLTSESESKFGSTNVGTEIAGSALEAAASSIGLGPAVVIGVEELVKQNPNIDQNWFKQTGEVLPARWIIDKIIPSENITTDPAFYDALPPFAKRGYALLKGVDAAEYSRINLQIYMTYVHRMETGEIERMRLDEIESKVAEETAAVLVMKGINNLSLPFIPQFTGEVNTMMNVWREYQDKWKENAFQEFYDDYPDWWIATASMSKNPGGVLSTVDSVNMAMKHKDLVNAIDGLVPEASNKFIGMILNKENGSTEFDPASRVWMYENGFYETLTPQEAINQAAVSKGNYDYYKNRDARDLAIKNFGISIGNPNLSSRNTTNSKVREENDKFKNWLDSQRVQNPTWWIQEWEPKANGIVQPAAIRALTMMIDDPKWMKDQDPDGWTNQALQYISLQNAYATAYNLAPNQALKDAIKEEAGLAFENLKGQNETWAYYHDRFFDVGDGQPFLQKIG